MMNSKKERIEKEESIVSNDWVDTSLVCPVIVVIAEEIAKTYVEAFEDMGDIGGKILMSFDKMNANHNYSLAVCLLRAVLMLRGMDVSKEFALLDACEEANPGAYGVFFDLLLTEGDVAFLMWKAGISESLEKMC